MLRRPIFLASNRAHVPNPTDFLVSLSIASFVCGCVSHIQDITHPNMKIKDLCRQTKNPTCNNSGSLISDSGPKFLTN